MSFESWAEEYFGANVDVPEACRDAWHAARAEALREASAFVGTSVLNGWPCAEKLRAMADREGK